MKTHTAQEAYTLVAEQAGCFPRDRVTKRVIAELMHGTGRWGRNAPAKPSDEWYLEGLAFQKAPLDSDGDGRGDACVPPGTLPGRIVVGENLVVGAGTQINKSAILGNDVTIGDYCIIDRAVEIGDGVLIGDRVVLGPGLELLVSGGRKLPPPGALAELAACENKDLYE